MGYGISDISNIFNRPKPAEVPAKPGKLNDTAQLKTDMDIIYKTEAQNWYSAKPYGFKTTTRDDKTFTMFLPINPSNLNITTAFATNMIPTLYGTVEEHSDIRYYDITIEGTTGMAPRFVEPGSADDMSVLYSQTRKDGRSSFPLAKGITMGGFFAKTLGALNQAKNKAADLLDGGVKPTTGITAEKSGYVAFHNLYKFLLQYKKDASGTGKSTSVRTTHPLTFFNYKDNNQYDVVVRNFTLRRSSQDPTLYYYSIQLRGYNLKSISNTIDSSSQDQLRKDLGINGIDSSSVLGDIKSLSQGAKSIIGSAVGGISVLGR